jgi:hypothetical protein
MAALPSGPNWTPPPTIPIKKNSHPWGRYVLKIHGRSDISTDIFDNFPQSLKENSIPYFKVGYGGFFAIHKNKISSVTSLCLSLWSGFYDTVNGLIVPKRYIYTAVSLLGNRVSRVHDTAPCRQIMEH